MTDAKIIYILLGVQVIVCSPSDNCLYPRRFLIVAITNFIYHLASKVYKSACVLHINRMEFLRLVFHLLLKEFLKLFIFYLLLSTYIVLNYMNTINKDPGLFSESINSI